LPQLGQARVQPPTVFRSLYEPAPRVQSFSARDDASIFDDDGLKIEELPSIFAVTRPPRKKPVPVKKTRRPTGKKKR